MARKKIITPKEARVLELAQDVCDKLQENGDKITSEIAERCNDDLRSLFDNCGVESEQLAEEPE